MIRAMDHVGIAVWSLDERLRFWAGALGMKVAATEVVEGEGVKVALLQAGPARIELLEPVAADSPIRRHLERRGEGIHHLTLAVEGLPTLLERLRAEGVEVIGDAVRTGTGGRAMAFLHPRSAGGVLVELVEGADRGLDEEALGPGQPVLLYLKEPQEKLWGILRRLDAAGVVVEGIEMGSFDDWVAQIERGEESVVGASVLFVPMIRVEKLLLDRPSGSLLSMAERFLQRTGRSVQEALRDPHGQERG